MTRGYSAWLVTTQVRGRGCQGYSTTIQAVFFEHVMSSGFDCWLPGPQYPCRYAPPCSVVHLCCEHALSERWHMGVFPQCQSKGKPSKPGPQTRPRFQEICCHVIPRKHLPPTTCSEPGGCKTGNPTSLPPPCSLDKQFPWVWQSRVFAPPHSPTAHRLCTVHSSPSTVPQGLRATASQTSTNLLSL